jgi:polyribonucleotide nucleotidyltransferase
MNCVSRNINDSVLSIDTGEMAKQADGSVLIRFGDSILLVTAVAEHKQSDKDFFPLMVEYREKFYASGRIPGGFFKREGRPGDRETLTARLIDRPIRPLFDKNFHCEVQVAAQVFSYDRINPTDVLGITGASAALALSDIPFTDIISGVRIGRIDGQFIVNPTMEQIEESDIDILVAGSDEAVIMVEGAAKEVDEADMVAAIELAHKTIKDLNALQRELVAAVGAPVKRTVEPAKTNPELDQEVESRFLGRLKEVLTIKPKLERQNGFSALMTDALAAFSESHPEQEKDIAHALEDLEKREVRRMILEDGNRVDGRGTKDIRPITCRVGVLPRCHGSALFTRGETQSLVSTTLGTGRDEQMLDTMDGENWKRFMLHYNFPSFCVGEVGFFRGPGRREIGHGTLAERALRPLIPDDTEFPYTIRVVSEILESNGSSSMASVCGGSLAMMDAGVPMAKPVAGIAMGLVKEGDRVEVLSDILGAEDHLGDMDFKVTGTKDGITAFQMDVKVAGITMDILSQALTQAKAGREHILGEMNKTLAESRPDISMYAPKITTIQIPVDKIREIIGPGGKVIRAIQEESGATIEVNDDGVVKVAAVDTASSEIAVKRIQEIIEEPEIGRVYEGEVKSILNFGAFVEILPGKDGLLHISEISYQRINNVEDVMSVGDMVKVKVIDVSDDGKVRLSKKALEEAPEGYEEDRSQSRGPSRSSNNRNSNRDRKGPRRR